MVRFGSQIYKISAKVIRAPYSLAKKAQKNGYWNYYAPYLVRLTRHYSSEGAGSCAEKCPGRGYAAPSVRLARIHCAFLSLSYLAAKQPHADAPHSVPGGVSVCLPRRNRPSRLAHPFTMRLRAILMCGCLAKKRTESHVALSVTK